MSILLNGFKNTRITHKNKEVKFTKAFQRVVSLKYTYFLEPIIFIFKLSTISVV